MAEKKVSGRKKSEKAATDEKAKKTPVRDSEYDDFLSKYSSDLRRRSTVTVREPIKKSDSSERARDNDSESRCGEIDPHLSRNPVSEHQILTKRTGRILSDDTGFKAMSYNQRFELKPEMPDLPENDGEAETKEFEDTAIPGQRTMADIVASGAFTEQMNVPVEGKIADENDLFGSTYKTIKDALGPDIGKSEKLRAIARTAADDTVSQSVGQLSFPAFDPLFRFPEEKESKKEAKKSKKHKKHEKNDSVQEQKPFDIDEKEIVTHSSLPEEPYEAENASPKKKKQTEKVFDVLTNSERQEEEPPFEISDKGDIKAAADKLKKQSRINLFKTGSLLALGVILLIISAVFENSDPAKPAMNPMTYSALNMLFLSAAGIVCVKEFAEGLRDIRRRKISQYCGMLFIYISSLIQSVASLFFTDAFPGKMKMISAASIISLTAVIIPKILLANNSRLAVSMFSGNNPVSILKAVSDGGIEGSIKERFAKKDGSVRYSSPTLFATGLMKKLTNAVPKPFGSNAAYALMLLLSLLVAIGSGIITKSVFTALSALAAMITVSLPVAYGLTAALVLFGANNTLAEKKSSLLSYRCASELTQTKAIIFNTSEIIEQESCSIHGIKTFGRFDPKKSTLCCAAVINAAHSPLQAIMKQVTDQSGEEIPEAENIRTVNGAGVSAYVDGNDVLLGTREFLEEHRVRFPKDDFEEKFITGDRKPLYLAVNGELTMLLIVSYHIKRSVAAFFKVLASRKIKIMIHSTDPNISAAYIAKKCKLKDNDVVQTDNTEASYFMDKENKTESALPADAFTNGSVMSVALLLRNAFRLTDAAEKLPFIIYILSAVGAMVTAIPILLGDVTSIGSIYILMVKIICFAVTLLILSLYAKKQESGIRRT